MAEPILTVQNLEKTYITFKKNPGISGAISDFFSRVKIPIHAVKPSSFNVNRGEFVGLLGPNGAGKTTILKMLTGLIPPTSGQAKAFGTYDTRSRDHQYLRKIGLVMGQRNQLHPDLPAMDSFLLTQAIYGLEQTSFQKRLTFCLELFQITDKSKIPVRKLSLGERMKLELINSILHEPELLFLDEPTIGLDFKAARQIREFLHHANRELGLTIILTSHYTKDIEELCKRVILINHGQIVFDGPLQKLDPRLAGERVVSIKCSSANQRSELVTRLRAHNIQITQSPTPSEEDQQTVTFVTQTSEIQSALKTAFDLNLSPGFEDILVTERELDEIFADIYERPTEARP
jgi:ABC-2 type transport system ATP-binding protein